MKILVTGVNGQLGSEIKELSGQYSKEAFLFADRRRMPLDSLDAIETILEAEQPDIIINCGAYTAVDKAESEPELADTINHLAVSAIADWIAKNNKRMIHISTDYVFPGNSERPLHEEDQVAPINIYGLTKLKGEESIMSSGADAIIIRTSWVYSIYGNNFVKTMVRIMSERKEISVISDQIGSPTYARDLARVIMEVIRSGKWSNGVYHFSNEGRISWYDFACAIRDIKGLDCNVIPISTDQYPTSAARPKYSLLDKSKIKGVYGVEVNEWKESLEKMLSKNDKS